MKIRLLGLSVVLGALVAFSGTLQAESKLLSDVFSVNFYAYGALGTAADQETVTLEEEQAAGYGDWSKTGWTNVEVPWGLGAPQAPQTLTSSSGTTATFIFKDCRNGGPYLWDTARSTLLGDGNGDLMAAHVNSTLETPGDTTQVFDMEVTDITLDTYDVIIYIGVNQGQYGDGTGKIVFNGGAELDFTLPGNTEFSEFVEIVNGGDTGNYIVFKGVTGPSFTLQVWGNGFNHIGPCGFQFGVTDVMNPSPKNGADTLVASESSSLQLSWTNLAPITDSTVVDVWWGTEPNALVAGYDMTKIVTAEGVDFTIVDSSTIDTYYWRVDSYLNGSGNVNEPNRIEGKLWSYSTVSDPAPIINSITVNQMTWSDGPVPLVADITNLGPAATNIAWTAQTQFAAEISIAGADTATPTVTISKNPYSQAKITNPGFETDQQDEDGWGNATGWSGGGNWNPPADSYTGSAVPEGNMCAWTSGTMSQTLAETLAADTQYELTVQVGNSMRYDWPEYNVQLVAGSTVLAEDPNLNVSVPRDSWALVTVSFNSAGVDPDLLGKPLKIQLSSLGNQPGEYAELNFDDVKLTADPPFATPPVETVTMTVAVSDAANPTPVTASMTIDVYDTACDVARIGEGKDNVVDLDKDCEVNIGDLKLMVSNEWLSDASLQGATANAAQSEAIGIPNGGFELVKPGTNGTVPAVFSGGYCSVSGDNLNLIVMDGVYIYGDGTTGIYADLPGWINSSGGNSPNLTAGGIDGSTYLGCYGNWSGGGGSRVTSSAPVGYLSGGKTYTLSVMFKGNPGTRVLRLFADGVEVTPSSAVDPADNAEWTEITRVYNEAAVAPHVGKAITVEVGTADPVDDDGAVAIDNVSLSMVTSNPNLPTVSAGADMVTWSGQPVALTPTVLNNDPNDPQAPLSYLWTVDPTEGVELSDATAMAPTITITQPSLYTSYLADPGLNDQGGWDAIGGGIGYYNSSFSNYTVEGAMCADIWGAPAGENGYAQTLAATLETDTEYELSVWLGTPDGYTAPIGYKVQLLAGGTVLAEEVADANSLPAVGVAVQSTVTFDSTGVDTGLVGQPLEIRLLGVMAAVDRENFGFDAAKLLINGKEMAIPGSSVPDPYTIDLKLAVTLEDEATVYDTVVIDVYDNACLAAAGADPAFKLDLGDINGDCITNLEDFAKLAAEWLVDYKATGPVAKPEI